MKRKAEMPDASFEAEYGGKDELSVEDELGAVAKSPSVEDGETSEGLEAGDKKFRWVPGFQTIVLCSLVLCLLLMAAVGLYFMKSKTLKASSPAKATVQSAIRVIRPVPQPDCREMLDFLIVYQVQGRDVITALRMEAVFGSLLKYANFKNETVLFRDTVYNFLLRQNAPDNTAKSWHSVFGENLLDYLKINLPDCCPEKIRLTQIENL